jgi:hypothetical protein
MQKVLIEHKGKKGFIAYDPLSLASVIVEFPDETKRQEIETYLKTEREFWIPESNEIDDYRIDRARPIDSVIYFELALSSLYGALDVWVTFTA